MDVSATPNNAAAAHALQAGIVSGRSTRTIRALKPSAAMNGPTTQLIHR
ncbi:MAG: hypothetical protein ACI8TP_004535 [Acidimicrobiales bacterium]|jgi:hypothetical protein